MSLAMLAALGSVPRVVFYSLQRGESARQVERPPRGMSIVAPELTDFADDAALIANLDLVVSIDSATAHLAGALGKPVWTLVAHPPEWRWLREGDRSPWYPEMRLFRRPAGEEWATVVARVASVLGEFVRRRDGA
jgi:ADP-heptose:LPS heptosyltransferase